jgi:hypothetical protein
MNLFLTSALNRMSKPRYKIWGVAVVQPARMDSRVGARIMVPAERMAVIS